MGPQADDWPTLSAERLRGALDPPPESVERLVRRALIAPPPRRPRRPRSFRLLAALASAAALAGVLASVLPQRLDSAFREESGTRVSISNQGDIVIARRPDSAGGWLVRSGPSAPPQSSQIVIVRYGEQP